MAHLAWSTLMVVGAGVLIAIELTAACPAGGPLAFGDCERVRPLGIATVVTAVALYVGGLTAVLAWGGGLLRRGAADGTAARDWYLVAAGVGLVACPLLGFTLVSAFR